MMILRSWLLAVVLLASANADARTAFVRLERDGTPLEGGEVCRFAAGDGHNPFRRWLGSQEVTCVAAGSEMEFPRGRWNVYGRIDGNVSPAPLLIDGDEAPARLRLAVAPAATVVPELGAGQRAVVYVPKYASAFPLAAGSDRVTVPAGEPLWLLFVEKALPVALVPVAPLEAGAERSVSASGATTTLLGWLRIPDEDRKALDAARAVSAPSVSVTFAGSARESDSLPRLDALNGAFVAIRGVTPGEALLEVGGRGWLPSRRAVKVAPAPLTVVNDALVARGAASIIVHWSRAHNLGDLEASIGSCEDDSRKAPELVVSLLACASSRAGAAAEKCRELRQQAFSPADDYGSFSVDEIAAGAYRAEMRFGKLPPATKSIIARPFEITEVRIAPHYEPFYGSLTRGGVPLERDAEIRFRGGIGFAEKESGEYRAAALSPLATDELITIRACDGSINVQVPADPPPVRAPRVNIDIPDNELTIRVRDTFTRMPLPEASVRYEVMGKRTMRPIISEAVSVRAPDAVGSAASITLEAIPERRILLTVYSPGYAKRRIPLFTMGRSEKKTIEVDLTPLHGVQGRLVSQHQFIDASITWYAPTGAVTGHADVAPDGSFVAMTNHGQNETMAIVSSSHPLWVTRSPEISSGREVSIPFPAGPGRDIEVSLGGEGATDERVIGLALGGVRVPYPALRQHQQRRRLGTRASADRPLSFDGIADTGTIEVILGPRVVDLPSRSEGIDIFALPRFENAPRFRLLPNAASIEIEVK